MLYSNFEYETVTIFFMEDENQFVDEHGFVLYDIFRIMTPNQLYLFKEKRLPLYIQDKESRLIYKFVVYPTTR